MTSVPRALRKRNVGKVGTAGIALFAGLALAATLFVVTQPGTAEYTPEGPGDDYVPHTLTKSDIAMSAFAIGDIDIDEAESFDSTDAADAALDVAPTTFSFSNANRDFNADVRVREVALAPDSTGGSDQALLDALYVHIYREAGTRDLIYSGKLSEWGQQFDYVSNIPADATQDFTVWAWMNSDDAAALAAAGNETIDLAFIVDYLVTDLAESNATPENGPATLLAPPNGDDLATLSPSEG